MLIFLLSSAVYKNSNCICLFTIDKRPQQDSLWHQLLSFFRVTAANIAHRLLATSFKSSSTL